jgi:hypothetical protein
VRDEERRMDQHQQSRWRPTRRQVLVAVGGVVALVLAGVWLWGVLADYIQPKTPTDKKDLVNVFVVIATGVIGSLTAITAVGNLIVSRRNLQQQRDFDERNAQDDALRAYYEQMGNLVTEHKLKEKTDLLHDPIPELARAQTSTLLERLGSESDRAKQKKGEVIQFLFDARLIRVNNRHVRLNRANLSEADLSGADFRDADLGGANLSEADLTNAKISEEQLRQAKSLKGATMPNGQKYEEWLKSKEGRGEDGKGVSEASE